MGPYKTDGSAQDELYDNLRKKFEGEGPEAAFERFGDRMGRADELYGRANEASLGAGLMKAANQMGSIGGVVPKAETSYMDQQAQDYRQRARGLTDRAESDLDRSQRERENALFEYLKMKMGSEDKAAATEAAVKMKEADRLAAENKTKEDREFTLKRDEIKYANDAKLAAMRQSQTNQKPPTTDQFKVATFARRIEQAEDDLRELDEKGFDRTNWRTAARSKLPRSMQGGDLQSFGQAVDNFINATLRRESGSAISDAEYEKAERQYFPIANDSPEVVAQKRANRQQVLAGMQAEASTALDLVPRITKAGSTSIAGRPQPGQAIAAPLQPSQADQAAIEWLKTADPADPRAQSIRQKLQAKGAL